MKPFFLTLFLTLFRRKPSWFGMAVLAVFLASCAGDRYHREGLNQLAEGKLEQGLQNLERAMRENPDNIVFRNDYLTRRNELLQQLINQAEIARNNGKIDQVGILYQRVLAIEPGNARALAGLESLIRDRRHVPLLEQAKEAVKMADNERAASIIKLILSENPGNADAASLKRQMDEIQIREQFAEPSFRSSQKNPITLEFRDANLKVVFEALARTSGVNFILDKDIRADLRTTVFLRQASLEDAIDLLLQTNRLEKKVLNRNTILIYPNTPDKVKDYQELMIKGFYLANADVKQTQAMLKAMIKAKDIHIDEKLNLLMMRDTPEAIRLAEKLIAMQDLNEPEVMLEVEVLEVKRSRLLELGVKLPNSLALTPLSSTGSTALRLSDLGKLNSDRLAASISGATLNLRREIGDANILANPRIRVRNREKAKVLIGDRVPTTTSTVTATGVVSESVQFQDVGIKLEVEPNIYLEDEVGIKIGLEVSSIVNEVRTSAGSMTFQIGTRSVNTVLRLKDGETQILAGLISDEDRSSSSRVPGVGDIPVVGRLFSSQKDDRQKTEVVLSITPRLIRNIVRPDAANSEFWSGTETTLRTQPLTLQVRAPEGASAAVAPAGAQTGNGVPDNAVPSIGNAKVKAPSAISIGFSGPTTAKVGETFKLALKLKADGGVRSFPFQLGFDSSVISVVNVTEGGYFSQNDAKTNLSSNVDLTLGKVFGNVLSANPDGAQGEGTVVVFTLKGLLPKASEIKLLSATPLVVGDKSPVQPELPAPFVITISP